MIEGSDVVLTCLTCGCNELYPNAWGELSGYYEGEEGMRGQAARVLGEGYGLPCKCEGCPCHTGVGLLPRLMIEVKA